MHKLLIALLIAFGAGDVLPSAQDTTTPDISTAVGTPQSSPVIINAGPAEIELVNEAVRRFEAHGMHLPPVEITFSDTREACDGFRGLHRQGTTQDPVDQISICDGWPVHLYHELAHAWEHHTVADATRTELLNRWQLSTWSDHSEDWEDRGIEQAAKTIAYALAYDHLPAGMNVRNYVCAFEMLTGKPLPAQVPVDCAPDTTTASTPIPATATEADSWIEKDPADDPRLAPITTAVSSGTETEVPWSWETEGPGSNSLHAPWLTTTTTP